MKVREGLRGGVTCVRGVCEECVCEVCEGCERVCEGCVRGV